MSAEFKIAETDNFLKKIEERDYKVIYNKIYNYVYPQLRRNPFFGPNIKKLKGEFSGVYRYRIGNSRLFYIIETVEKIVYILDVKYRKDSYKK